MKRILLLVIFILTFASIKTADALIYTGGCVFTSFSITPDGTNPVTVTFYDNTSGSGTKILNTMTFAGDEGPIAFPFKIQKRCFNGIYADITTAGTVEYAVFWERQKNENYYSNNISYSTIIFIRLCVFRVKNESKLKT